MAQMGCLYMHAQLVFTPSSLHGYHSNFLLCSIHLVHISADLGFSDRERDALSHSSGGSDAGRTDSKNGWRLVFTTSLIGVQFGLDLQGLPTSRYSHFPYRDTVPRFAVI
jgi:hypothetical protein